MLRINVVTLFPQVFEMALRESIPGRAQTAGVVSVKTAQLRDFAHDRHRTVDDYPYGGGAGMVLKPEPISECIESLDSTGPILLMSARGRRFNHDAAVRLSLLDEFTILCGHYKDVDQRVIDELGAEEWSIGDFILSGGEPAAWCVIDAVIRLLPGALGDHESASGDSHYDLLLSAPSYTRPPVWRGREVPEVLRSGDHAKVAEWRRNEAMRLTQERRPDLWAAYQDQEQTD